MATPTPPPPNTMSVKELNALARACAVPEDHEHLIQRVGSLPDPVFWELITDSSGVYGAPALATLRAALPQRLPRAPWLTSDTPTTQIMRLRAVALATRIDPQSDAPLWVRIGVPTTIHPNVSTAAIQSTWMGVVGCARGDHMHHIEVLDQTLRQRGSLGPAVNDLCSHGWPDHAIHHVMNIAVTNQEHITTDTWGRLAARICVIAPNDQALHDAWAQTDDVQVLGQMKVYMSALSAMVQRVPSDVWCASRPCRFLDGFFEWAKRAPDKNTLAKIASQSAFSCTRLQFSNMMSVLGRADVVGAHQMLRALLTSAIPSHVMNEVAPPLISQCSPEDMRQLDKLVWSGWDDCSLIHTAPRTGPPRPVPQQTSHPGTLITHNIQPATGTNGGAVVFAPSKKHKACLAVITALAPSLSVLFDHLPEDLKDKWVGHPELQRHLPSVQAANLTSMLDQSTRPSKAPRSM